MSATIPTVTSVTSTKGKVYTNHPVNANQIITLDCEAMVLIDNCDNTQYPAIKMNTSDDGDIVWVYPNTPAGEADRVTDCAALGAAINPPPTVDTNIYNSNGTLTGPRTIQGGGNSLTIFLISNLTVLSTGDSLISSGNKLELNGTGTLQLETNLGGKINLKTDNVLSGSATNGQILTLIDAPNGTVEYKTKTLLTKSAIVVAGSFAASPADFKSVITFTTAFPNNNYTISITGEDNRAWTVETKSSTGFTINSNSAIAVTGNTFYQAIETGETE